MPAGSQAPIQSILQKKKNLNPSDFGLCYDKQQHDTSLQTKMKTQGNSIKL